MMGPSAFQLQRRVEFAETDMAGMMHFSNFFRFMEIAEHAFYRKLDIPIHPKGESNTFAWPRVHAQCDYKYPVHFGDILTICVAVQKLTEKTIHYTFDFHLTDVDTDIHAAHGKLVVACTRFDSETQRLRAAPIPGDIRIKLETAPEYQ